eukprot:gene8570-10543_t
MSTSDPSISNTPDSKWSYDQVFTWAKRFVEVDVAEMLKKERVDGAYLVTLNQKSLRKEIGIPAGIGNRVGILGNPGIGKTFLSFYIMYHARIQNISVIYDSINYESVYFFTFENNVPIVGVGSRNSNFFENFPNDTIYLVDTKSPIEINPPARTILVTSPDPKVLKNFDKLPKSTRLYMPIWSFDELSTARILYPNVTEQKMKELFSKWGGIPRFVLQYALDKTQQEQMEIALGSKNLKACLESIGEVEAPDKATHKLVHYVVGKDFTSRKLRFASGYVIENILFNLQTKTLALSLSDFFQSRENYRSSLGGTLYESHVHTIIRKGSEFQLISKKDKSKISLYIPEDTRTIFFRKYQDITEPDLYAIPKSRNYPVIDSIFGFGSIFQVTISPIHAPLRIDHLEPILDHLKSYINGDEIQLIFVCPSGDGDYFKKTRYSFPTLSKKEKDDNFPNMTKNQIQEKRTSDFEKKYNLSQYVLIIDSPNSCDILYNNDEVLRNYDLNIFDYENEDEDEDMEIESSP